MRARNIDHVGFTRSMRGKYAKRFSAGRASMVTTLNARRCGSQFPECRFGAIEAVARTVKSSPRTLRAGCTEIDRIVRLIREHVIPASLLLSDGLLSALSATIDKSTRRASEWNPW